jgi:hypothetical protein
MKRPLWAISFHDSLPMSSLVNCDMKLSTEKCCLIPNFISTLDDVAALKTVWWNLHWEWPKSKVNNLANCWLYVVPMSYLINLTINSYNSWLYMWAVILIYGSYFLSYSLTNFIGVQGVLIKGIWCWDYRAKPQIVNENHSSIYVGQLIQPKLGNTEFQSQCHKKKDLYS